MHFTPTTFVAKLLAAMQVLMTLDMPLSSTTMALPVTSKPIESTVENLAWQAWIELPPEQKQQVKSRKVTPKSIFTLPLRVECPEGHKQVDTKCIPIAIGSNDVLIDLNALGLLVGSTQTEDVYDYDDMGEEFSNPLAFGSDVPVGETIKPRDGLTIDLRPPTKDEPLKFNIFENKFHIFHEEPMEDYAAISNEGLQSSEKEQNATATTTVTPNESSNAAENVTAIHDLASEASNISENNFGLFVQPESNFPSNDASTNLSSDADFKIEAISIPAFEVEKPKHNHNTIQLITTIMDADTLNNNEEHDKQQENDITTLLQTESFLPLLNHTTATTLQNSEKFSLTAMPSSEASASSPDILVLNVDEEITTLPNAMEPDITKVRNKQEYTRSVTTNPLQVNDNESTEAGDSGDNDQVKDTTLEIVMNDELVETTTPIQLDETTIIESHSSLSATPSKQQELQLLMLPQEPPHKDFEELQRNRKGQKDQHVVSQKSKVQPVEVLATTTEPTTKPATAATTAANLPTATTKPADELLPTTAETATPLLTVHNKNEKNDRFYYQHFAKQDKEVSQRSGTHSKQTTTVEAAPVAESATAAASASAPEAATTGQATKKPTSEIDLAEELRLINDLVKGIQRPTTLKTITKMRTTTTTTTTTTAIPTTSATTTATTQTALAGNSIQSTIKSANDALSESSSSIMKKPTLTKSQIWSKILPLLTTSTAASVSKSSVDESFSESHQKELNNTKAIEPTTLSSMRSNRNSKIIRINGFNKISAAKLKAKEHTTPTTTTTILEDSTEDSTTSSPSSSTTENLTYEPFWWLPVSWRPDKPASSEEQHEEQQETRPKELPLLLRFWSAYAPKSVKL